MKRSKRLSVLFGILVLVCAATFAVTRFEERKEQIKSSGETVLEVPVEDIQSLRWEYGGTTLSFHKEGIWLYDDDESFPVDEEKIRRLLEPFEAFGVSFIIEDVSDYGMYGLDTPECTIWFETETQSYQIDLGDFSSMDQERYISLGDGNVYLAKADPLDQFDVALRDLICHDEDLAYEEISQIKFEGAENYTIFYEEESPSAYCADDVYFTEKDGKTLPLDTDWVGDYLETLTTLNPSDYVTYNVTEEELASYGLDQPELKVTVDYTAKDENGAAASDTFTLSISQNPEELAAAEAAEAKGEEPEEVTGYIRIGDSQIVYQISAYTCKQLLAVSYNNLRHWEVLSADFEDVYQLDISLEGKDYTIAADGEKDGERVWKYQEEEIDFSHLQNELAGLRSGGTGKFSVEDSAGKEEIRLTVWLENENRPQVEIELYRYDGSDCLAKVDGETFALVSRSDVVDLMEAVNAIVLN